MVFVQLAWRNIWRNKMRSTIIIGSISIGLFAGIAVLSLYQGMMEGRIKTVIEEEIGHLQLHHPRFSEDYEIHWRISASDEIKHQLLNTKNIKAISTRSIAFGMLSTTAGSKGVQINGIIPEEEDATSQLNQKIIDGTSFTKIKKHQILIGKKLADKLNLHIGSKIILTLSDSYNDLVAGAYNIVGIFQSANTPLDEKKVYVNQKELNDLLSLPQGIHEISVLLTHNDSTEPIQQLLKTRYPNLLIENWKELSPETNLLITTVDQYSLIILVIIFIALAFGIINTMLMAILERTREIGMMLALGTGRLQMFGIVMTETFFLTLAGTPPGILISRILVKYYHQHGIDLSNMGTELMSSFGFKTIIYPVFPSEKIISTTLIVGCTALISGLLPAWKALRMKPSDALRN